MKILYICTFYHRALLFRQQMDALEERGHYVRAFNSAQYGEGIADKFLPIMDEKVVHCECWNRFDRLLFYPRQWKIEKKLQSAFNLSDYDLLHSHLLLSSGYSALRMKRKYAVPYVVSVRVTDLTGFIRIPYFRKMAVEILRNSNGILFLSNSHKSELLNSFLKKKERLEIEKKCYVIGNCLEPFWTEHRAEPRTESIKNKKQIKILSVAKIRPIKNLTVAAEAVNILCKHGIKATLTIVGEDQDAQELSRILKYKCVHYIPFLSKEELIDVYKAHDIFVLPSVNETFGRVYLEAMSQGLPVIYSKGQGFDGNFRDGEIGYAVPSDNPQYIAKRIRDIIHRYTEISKACINNSLAFDEKAIMDRLEMFYQESLNRG